MVRDDNGKPETLMTKRIKYNGANEPISFSTVIISGDQIVGESDLDLIDSVWKRR